LIIKRALITGDNRGEILKMLSKPICPGTPVIIKNGANIIMLTAE